MAIEEQQAILFMLGADKYKYRKLIEHMKNDILRKKDPFPKSVAEACHILSKWKNNYGGKYNIGKSDSNNGIAFTTVKEEKETNKNKKRKISFYKCTKKVHYSYKCIEELPTTTEKKGTSLLINKDDSSDKELENEQYKTEEEDVSVTSEVDSTKHVIKPSKKGLFYSSVNNYIVLGATVEDKFKKYTIREYLYTTYS